MACSQVTAFQLQPNGVVAGFRELVTSATGRRGECATGFGQPGSGQRSQSSTEGFSRQRMNVVKVDDAISGYAIGFSVTVKLGYETAARAGQCRHNDGPDSSSDR